MQIIPRATPAFYKYAIEEPTLTNYIDKYIFMTGGVCRPDIMHSLILLDVLMYDIKLNSWSLCP